MMKESILAVAALLALVLPPAHAESPPLEELVPASTVTADVMELASPPRAHELARRIQVAISADPGWFQQHLRQVEPGEALPYDARLGVTQQEYQEYLQLATMMTLARSRQVQLGFRREAEGIYVFEAPELADLAEVRLEFKEDRIQTPFGTLATRTAIDNRDEDSATGPWAGTQWSFEDVTLDGKNGVLAKLAIGRLTLDGRGILYYTGKEMKGGKIVRRADAILFYPLGSSSP